jgi:hypothetical protein
MSERREAQARRAHPRAIEGGRRIDVSMQEENTEAA